MENRDVKIEKDGITHILHLDENDKPTSKKKITQSTTQDTIKKSILSLANLTIGYSIIQIVILPLYMLFIKGSSILAALLIIIFFIPMLVSGIRMRKIGDTDTGKIKRIITFLIIYSIIIVLLSLFGGGRPSILVFILLYKLFKTKKEIKKEISKDLTEEKIGHKER
ncbi:TPA: MFS transporter [Candidatus Dojkabacteria bacterium]|jgi:hypothetical protein|uniref:MFS transporter n=1 Tax=Candidatus Dojkabacteria bacterium TaxID=2099670 RepID=A0A832QC30_9BACT|nr:MFS transporter [Candidatus Dojkabacteria bacterium]